MSLQSTIEWTDATWNPVTGCTEVSPGCDHCYARTFAERWRGTPGHPYEQGFDLRLWPNRLNYPLQWKKPLRIFTNSMSDLFHKDVPDEYILDVFGIMAQADWHIFQVLTKRPSRLTILCPVLLSISDSSQNLLTHGRSISGSAYLLKQCNTSGVWTGFGKSPLQCVSSAPNRFLAHYAT